jgi:hypothetical protein
MRDAKSEDGQAERSSDPVTSLRWHSGRLEDAPWIGDAGDAAVVPL